MDAWDSLLASDPYMQWKEDALQDYWREIEDECRQLNATFDELTAAEAAELATEPAD